MLQDQVDVASWLGSGADRGCHFVHPVLLLDCVHGVEAQPVEAVFSQPVSSTFSVK